jgi:ABC transport system ATP-binding/permease protein
MLKVVQLSHSPSLKAPSQEGLVNLDRVDFILSVDQVVALVGPGGSGKSLVLRLLAGLERMQSGCLTWGEGSLSEARVSYLGKAQLAVHTGMSTKEQIVVAALLLSAKRSYAEAIKLADRLLLLCDLDAVRGVRAEVLRPLDRRRLAVAIALVNEPEVLLVDDLVAELPRDDARAFVELLKKVLKAQPGRVILHARNEVAELESYDTAVVLHEGRVAFHGPPRAMGHYFTIQMKGELFTKLMSRAGERWQDSWSRHRDAYYAKCEVVKPAAEGVSLGRIQEEVAQPEVPAVYGARSGMGRQVAVLMKRQWTQVRRYYGKITFAVVPLLYLAALLVMCSQAQKSAGLGLWYLFQTGLIFTGIVPLVVPVVALSRESAAMDAACGVSAWVRACLPMVWTVVWSVLVSAVVLLVAESFMGILPGHGGARGALILLGGVAFAALCGGLAAWSRSVESATSRAWALVVVNLVFSGALVAWPRGIGALTQPLFTAAQVWGGCMESMKGTVVFEVIKTTNATWFPPPTLAFMILGVHLAVGLAAMVAACRRAD